MIDILEQLLKIRTDVRPGGGLFLLILNFNFILDKLIQEWYNKQKSKLYINQPMKLGRADIENIEIDFLVFANNLAVLTSRAKKRVIYVY